ncbi:MAG: ATP-dependent 6-phosphofructokinase [Planctomycetota bacterium]|nr:MAG: ATP-dependent 6-phosphofructokinase [Planctomycetota bacterium]
MKLAVLTVGGDAPGLNAAIRAVVRAAAYRYGSDVVGIPSGFEGLLRPPQFWSLAPGDVRGLVRRGGTLLGCNHSDPFATPAGDRSEEVVESVRWLGIDGVICIGGMGTISIAARLSARGVPVLCIPKTVENDVPGTKVTFGHTTAVELATAAIDNLQTTGETEHRVMYLEVLGREAGWIALHAGIAGGADVILIPEIPYAPERVVELIRERRRKRKPSTIVVVAEGARARDEEQRWPAGRAAERVRQRVSEDLGEHEALVTVLGHLQRGGDPNPQDRVLATRFGAAAVRAAHEGRFGNLVALRGSGPKLVPLERVVGRVRRVDPEGDRVWTAVSMGISLGRPRGH